MSEPKPKDPRITIDTLALDHYSLLKWLDEVTTGWDDRYELCHRVEQYRAVWSNQRTAKA